ncbi:Rossmann-fold NAD(P)-binding domain-containing protein [Arthrobacter pigmenti]
MRIAIVGATGNVGTALLRRIKTAAPETDLVGVVRRKPSTDREPYQGVTWHELDIGRFDAPDKLAVALQGADAVVHLGWILQPNHREEELYRVNVIGTGHVADAAGKAGVRHLVYASSVGTYSPAPKDRRLDEKWPTGGIHTSHYSRQKAATERIIDRFDESHPQTVVTRLRPGLIFQADNGSEVGRYFLGPVVPKSLADKIKLPVLPMPRKMVFQAVHADDVAEAYWLALKLRAGGAFNIAAEPALTPSEVARIFGAKRTINIPVNALRVLAAVTWKLRLQRSDPGWIDMAGQAPVMDTERARSILGWSARKSSVDALRDVLFGLGSGTGVKGSPPLHPREPASGGQKH